MAFGNFLFPKVTVVTVCFNALEDLRITASSVLSLTYPKLEYVIVDGGSTDGTREYLSQLPENVIWVSEPDPGIYYAMNKAVSIATGEWVIFMNAGDVFCDSDIVEKVMRHVTSECDFIYGDRIRVEVDGSSRVQAAGDLKDYLKTEVVYHQALFNRTARLRRRPYNTNYRLAADYEYVVHAITSEAVFKYIKLPICKFQCGGRSRTYHVRCMTEAIKISIDYQPAMEKWTESDFFKNYIGNHIEATLNEYVNNYLQAEPSLGGEIFSDESSTLRVSLNKPDKDFERLLARVLRPLSKLNLQARQNKNTMVFLPKISIVTVVYNDIEGIKKTLPNVSQLTYPNSEYIVIDGSSNDGTLEYLNEHIDKIDILKSESDGGIYDAMNKAIDVATGDYVIFMNSGDEFASASAVEALLEGSDYKADVIYGDRNYVAADGTRSFQPAKDIATIFERMPYCHQSAFVKLSVLRRFKFDVTYKYAADYHQVVLMYCGGVKFQRVEGVVSNFFAGGKSESGIRPYLEVVKIQLDNAPGDFDSSKSVYIRGLKNNFSELLRGI